MMQFIIKDSANKVAYANEEELDQLAHEIVNLVKERCGIKSNYWVCRVYANRDTNWGERTEKELIDFVRYNSVMRFGCALIIEGVCYYTGYYKTDEISHLEKYITDFYNLGIGKNNGWCQVVSVKDNKAYFSHAYKPCYDFMQLHKLSDTEYKIVRQDLSREKAELTITPSL